MSSEGRNQKFIVRNSTSKISTHLKRSLVYLALLIRIIPVLLLNVRNTYHNSLYLHEAHARHRHPDEVRGLPKQTQNTPGKPIKLLCGAAAIALQSSAKILPVIISRSPVTLTKREKWYQIPKRNLFSVCMWGDDIEVNPIDGNASRSLAMRNITRQLEEYFIERQVHYENP